MPRSAIVAPVLALAAIVGIVRAEPPPVDASRQNEEYVIQPGAEKLFADMLGGEHTLPGGCTLGDGQIERTSVLATYTCGGGQVVLQLLHPGMAPPGSVLTQRFAIAVNGGAAPDGLVQAVADRIRAREAAFEWTDVRRSGTWTVRWPVPVAAGAVVAVLAFLALRRLTARRRLPA